MFRGTYHTLRKQKRREIPFLRPTIVIMYSCIATHHIVHTTMIHFRVSDGHPCHGSRAVVTTEMNSQLPGVYTTTTPNVGWLRAACAPGKRLHVRVMSEIPLKCIYHNVYNKQIEKDDVQIRYVYFTGWDDWTVETKTAMGWVYLYEISHTECL